jgi:hypothetical protein
MKTTSPTSKKAIWASCSPYGNDALYGFGSFAAISPIKTLRICGHNGGLCVAANMLFTLAAGLSRPAGTYGVA